MQSTTKLRITELGIYVAVIALAIVPIVRGLHSANPVSLAMRNEMNQFARLVTEHLLDSNYASYENSTKALMSSSTGELVPPVIDQLQRQNCLPHNLQELTAKAKLYQEQKRSSAVQIDRVRQQDLDRHSLVPIEVSGVVSLHSSEEADREPVPFRFRYLMGLRPNTQSPIVAKFEDLSSVSSMAK